ncbi:pentatricopeptide repeat-containing protein At4g02750 [Selaginella moellendorffii]|uniref:pentatricopeptide repeat-containing protein At4g02750 n=1 Tax=Selaginella moellendorffii TaxID=88036 RepID=UPI000D1CC64F|nr:pentatricopeptide repeat-containing protein At4g02750 [Selaginella moellendorffii]|eukprot:XP_024537224.1 pentatricopeptide repeat-containing protein At4g02750 [Selaginella moellendorffii]
MSPPLWNNLLAAYAKEGHFDEARRAFKRMPQFSMEACIAMSIACVNKGKLQSAQRVFEKCHHKDILSWNSILAAFARSGHLLEAKLVFKRIPRRDFGSFKGIIAAYVKKGKPHKGRMIFRRIPQTSRVLDPEISEMLIRGYGSQGMVMEAKNVFESMPQPSASCWAAMVECSVKNKLLVQASLLLNIAPPLQAAALGRLIQAFGVEAGDFDSAKRLFDGFRSGSGVEVWNTMLRLCCTDVGKLEFAKVVFDAMPERNFSTWDSIFGAYLRLKSVEESRILFDSVPERTSSWWSSMISAYTRQGYPAQALRLFKLMDLDGFRPDYGTYGTALFVCSSDADKDVVRKAMRMSKQQRARETAPVDISSPVDSQSILEPCYELDLPSPQLAKKQTRQKPPPGTISKKQFKERES